MHGYHDDLAISASIGLFVMSTTLNDMIATKDSIMASLKAMGNQYDSADDLAVLNKSFSKQMRVNNPWQMVTGAGTTEDLSWLIRKK